MKIVLATGIFPPEIGGPATYVKNLAKTFSQRQLKSLVVIAYGEQENQTDGPFPIIRVSRRGGPLARWRRYAKALREHASDADIVYMFSSVSCGVPMWLAKLKNPKKILRLGGDFLWERYTDKGGLLSLKDFYADGPKYKGMMNGLLRHFDYIIFSTAFQQELYGKFYQNMPLSGVIENALPIGVPVHHEPHKAFKLLFMGRFVSFKNLGSLLIALKELEGMTLTIAGEGPLEGRLATLTEECGLGDRVSFLPSQSGDAKQQLFLDHDLLVLPSYTEISPNTALEARASGLPVLLTEETGLSRSLSDGTQLRALRSPQDIVNAIRDTFEHYEMLADRASAPINPRTWDQVADEHLNLFRNLL